MIKIMSELRLKNRSERDLRIIAQSVEHRTGIAEVVGSHPVEASEFYGASISYDLVIWTTDNRETIENASVRTLAKCESRRYFRKLIDHNQSRSFTVVSVLPFFSTVPVTPGWNSPKSGEIW